MKAIRLITTAVAVMAACAVFGAESKNDASKTESKAVVAQTKCPVMGGDINKEVYADHEGKRVYFCCEACISTFKENPEKYLAKLKEAGVEPEAIPADDAAPAENMDHTDHEGHSEHAK